jgi:hypothetical protein
MNDSWRTLILENGTGTTAESVIAATACGTPNRTALRSGEERCASGATHQPCVTIPAAGVINVNCLWAHEIESTLPAGARRADSFPSECTTEV